MFTSIVKLAKNAGKDKFDSLLNALNGKINYSEEERQLIQTYSNLYGVPVSLNQAYRIQEAYKLCHNCPGLQNCPEAGLTLITDVHDGALHFSYSPCAERKARIRQERFTSLSEAAGLPDIYDNLNPTNHQLKVIDAISNSTDQAWFYIHGNLATGKTFAAVRAAKHLIYKGKSVKFFNTAELLSRLNPQAVQLTLDSVVHPDVLILDDFGAQYKSDWSNDRLFMVVDGRYRKKGITIFTSNYPPLTNSSDLLLARIFDRIKRRANIILLNT